MCRQRLPACALLPSPLLTAEPEYSSRRRRRPSAARPSHQRAPGGRRAGPVPPSRLGSTIAATPARLVCMDDVAPPSLFDREGCIRRLRSENYRLTYSALCGSSVSRLLEAHKDIVHHRFQAEPCYSGYAVDMPVRVAGRAGEGASPERPGYRTYSARRPPVFGQRPRHIGAARS